MSFSSGVKHEILENIGPRHCRIAELSAIIDNCGKFDVVFSMEGNIFSQAKFNKLAEIDFKQDFTNSMEKVLQACGRTGNQIGPTKAECCKKAYMRGAYLAVGTMADPRGAYHMEFAVNSDCVSTISEVFTFFGLTPKQHMRKSQQILYFKEAEQIATILNAIGAHVALMQFENCRVDKDVNNAINRASNAVAANENKIIAASANHIKDIMDIHNLVGLSSLGDGLAQVAQMRLDNPLLSLEDIGRKLSPPISKSGVNHRLKKIAQIAEMHRQKHGNKPTGGIK